MDVNRVNFWLTLPTVLEAIASAEYVAIDLEMTGVQMPDSYTGAASTQEQHYLWAKEVAKFYNIIQFGLTCFMYCPVQNCLFPLRSLTIDQRVLTE